MKTQVQALAAQGAQALILDLRANPGGIVQEAVCMGGIFVGNQKIVEMKRFSDQATREVNENAPGHPYFPLDDEHTRFTTLPFYTTDLPMVTLINGSSASASEILSGALQDYKRSWLVGDRTYGKASVQINDKPFSITDQLPLFEEPKMTLFSTEARFYQPFGRTNQIVGIVPDFSVDPIPHATEEQKFVLREADSYTNALPAVGAPWVNPRSAEIATISQCVKATGTAEKMYDAHKDDTIRGDFQVYSAEDILKCALSQ
jgi:carboxyl-terminal processing protease